ncbi:phytoene desaturase family protein [Streptomyces sp. NBC_01602]|uniref:phytoene desaturase family protein n=2 Tax=Streptomyces TaxID=1883 RepID=UPI0038646935|nr:NAD(P)/FAD-dependent oxidoreductase [Streptomyces sp. NBC_01602]
MTEVDAVVIGSGVNGLVAAAELACAGWSVVLVERNPDIGGFIATEQRTLPGYLHDTYSSWHPLFVSGPAFASLGELLRRHGLEYRNTDAWVTASVADDGRVTLAHRDPERTVAGFAHETDRIAYLAALSRLNDNIESIGGLMASELRSPAPFRHLAGLFRNGGRAGVEQWLRSVASSGRGYARTEFRGSEVDHLFAPWLLHAGLSPDHATGGLMVPLLAATLHGFGLPVVAGGSGCFLDAFRSLLGSLNVRVETSTPVERVLVERGRAVGVVAAGRVLRARRAVLASVTPTALYGSLLQAGLLPRRPSVVVGQQYVLDPSRVPTGAAALWLQLQEVPFSPRGDAADELDTTQGWTPELVQGYTDRVLQRLAQQAPDLHDRILAVDVVTPPQLARYNPNSVEGDPYGGSLELEQSFLWRPLPSSGRHATTVPGLWHIGASTHPGPGLGGSSGHMVATALIKQSRRTRRFGLSTTRQGSGRGRRGK